VGLGGEGAGKREGGERQKTVLEKRGKR